MRPAHVHSGRSITEGRSPPHSGTLQEAGPKSLAVAGVVWPTRQLRQAGWKFPEKRTSEMAL